MGLIPALSLRAVDHLEHVVSMILTQVAARQKGDQGFTWNSQFTLPKKEGE